MPRRVRGGASSAATSGANRSLPALVRSPSPAQSPSAKQMGEGLRDAGHVINQSIIQSSKSKHLTAAGGLWEPNPISLDPNWNQSFGTLNHFTPEVASARLSDRTLLTRKDRSAGRRRSSERETPPPFPLEARGSLSGARQCPHLTPQRRAFNRDQPTPGPPRTVIRDCGVRQRSAFQNAPLSEKFVWRTPQQAPLFGSTMADLFAPVRHP